MTMTSPATDVPVLITGAGLAGLSTAMFLGLHGLPSLVAERHPGLSTQPKARGQMPATMEALRAAGVAELFRAAAPPGRPETAVVIAHSASGPVLHSFTQAEPDFAAFSPEPSGLVSQERAEAILAGRATELGATIEFRTALESFRQEGDGVTAVVRDLLTGSQRTVRAGYLVAADGHKGTIRDDLGIGTHGRSAGAPRTAVFIQFDADLSATWGGSAAGIYYLQNAALPAGSATLVSTDSPGRHVCAISLDAAGDVAGLTEQRCAEIIAAAAGVPDLAVTIVDWSESSGSSGTRVADSFGRGRVFLAGDSAHLMPPTGGQGGNAAVMDGYHLAWKLAAVAGGQAGPGLLDSHDTERRPFADLLAEQQYANMVHRYGLPDDGTLAELVDPVTGLFGYCCPSGAFLGEPAAASGPFEDPAAPSGRPGCRAPHVPLLHDGEPVSTRDLYGRDFVLLAGAEGGAWAAAGAEAAGRLGIAIEAWTVGGPSASGPALDDPGRLWTRAYGVTPAGAVLVRPDGIIAWRAADAADTGQLERALRVVLDRA
jgi:putative polyketide hydroxylase